MNIFKKVIFVVIILLICLGIGFIYLLMQNDIRNTLPSFDSSSDEIINPNSLAPTTVLPKTEINTVNSPDGKFQLIMRKTSSDNIDSEYSFSIQDILTKTTVLIFEKKLSNGQIFELPQNSWSPDNKYIFIKERTNTETFFVFKASGEPFFDNIKYIDVLESFEKKNINYKLDEVTGWDSPTLLHLLTKGEDGRAGASFWFEVPSKAVIQLSSR